MFSSRAAHVALVCLLFGLTTAAVPAVASADDYVALGDSFSSGVGTNSYTLSSSCRRGVYAYPWLVAQQRPNTSLTFVACSGAKTTDVMANQIQSVTAGTEIVTITIGGNDIGFSNLIVQCTLGELLERARQHTRVARNGPGPTARHGVHGDQEPHNDRDRRRARLPAHVLQRRLLRHARHLGDRTGEGELARGCARPAHGERAAAAEPELTYRSAIVPFTGHAVCSGSAWLNGLNLFNTGESYHPNRNGNSLGYAPIVRSVVG